MAAASATWQRAALLAALLWAAAASEKTCGTLDRHENDACREDVTFFAAPVTEGAKSGKNDPNAENLMKDMGSITGVDFKSASRDDLQRLYFCSPPGGHQCGLPPCSCSKPPCDSCFGGVAPPQRVSRPGCEGGGQGIHCKPPTKALGYKGLAWPTMTFPGKKEMHIFAIGDWGGMDGTLNPIENREELLVFNGGKKAGPSVFPRTRWDKHHNSEICDHKQFIECFDQKGYPPCVPGCGYVRGVDDQPQILVANAFKARASLMKPDYILNVGDNFYWGGIEKNCGTPMGQLSYTALHQFNQIFEGVYTGQALSKVPWLSVLGNHDYGGRVFNNGWDQQIAYTWYSKRWVMPSPYWSQHVEYPDLNFTVDIYMLDSNAMDAKDPEEDPEHNLCGAKHNPGNADCTAAEGPSSVASCKAWFWDLWAEQQIWIEEQLNKSEADWQIAVTHFPCGHQKEFYKKLHQIDYGFPNVSRGLDLLVTGHRHDQELWDPAKVEIGDDLHDLGGLTCFVTGGGGGITSEATPNPYDKKDWYGQAQYGFYDLTITKNLIVIKSLNYDGKEVASILPQAPRPTTPLLPDRIEMAAASATWQRAALLAALLWAAAASEKTCSTLDRHENDACREDVTFFAAPVTEGAKSGKNDPNAENLMKDVGSITGVDFKSASRDDLQRLYFCSPPGGHQCGLPPCSCSKPPCVAPPQRVSRPGCEGGGQGIHCKPPTKALGYKGLAWPTMTFPGKKEMHIFAIGDWGGMDGTLNPIENREELLVFNGGKKAGPSVFPRTRWDKHHNSEICDHKQFIECFDQKGYPPCVPGCGYVRGVDDQPQILVANAFKARASLMKPDYILNVGDNFYWGGIEKNCGTPMGQLSYTALHQFNQIFEGVYTGQALSKVPWLSVLGNHDYGGRVFNNGWDQQIAYTWYSKRWVMPSPYWSQHVEYPDLNFTVDIYMLDSNAMDAKDPEEDPEHNLCGAKHNPGNADCTAAEGPSSVASCKAWFWDLWAEQQIWIEEQLNKSEADWQIAVTHFPCGHQKEFYKKLHQIDYGFPNVSRGLDLLVTGHRHDQELWDPAKVKIGDELHDLGGLTCFVTGGGGGITSEATPNPYDKKDWYGQAQYGFYDLTITKNLIVIKSLNYDGKEVA
ncbi:unnamed protein product, partial [Polarella glacialis]